MADIDSDTDSWVHLDFHNPADTDDDDAGVRFFSSGCTTPDCISDDDEHLGFVLTLSSTGRRRSRSPSLDPVAEDDDDDESLFDLDDAEVAPLPPPTPKPLSGLFHHMLAGGVSYVAFDPIRAARPPKEHALIRDPSFSVCGEEVTILASNRGLVCLLANASGDYILVNPTTHDLVRLPSHSNDHLANGNPVVVITFDDANMCCEIHGSDYHVVVAFPLGDGIYAYESFSSKTWTWTVGDGVSAVEQLVSASGVGALGCAFWRTTLGYILCYDPDARTDHLIPAPEEVLRWPHWELGEMNGTLSVACVDDPVEEVVIINLRPLHETGGHIVWSLAGHFEGGCLRNHPRVELLRSQGPEVVMWDPMLELVVATDIEGRTTGTIGPLSGRQYYSDFIPFICSSTKINRINDEGDECKFAAANAEA